LFSNDRCSY